MKKNVGTTDRIVRLILGVIIIGLGLYFKSWWGVIGIIPLITGLIRYCGLYSVFGINTCRIRKPEE